MVFSAIYKPTTLFSLKSSNATNSGAKSLFLPSPYAIKMAILNQAITVGGELGKLSFKKSKEFGYVRDAQIGYNLPVGTNFCVNNSFVKILKLNEDKRSRKQKEEGVLFEPGFTQTVAFREYVYISNEIEIIFEVIDESAANFLKRYLHKINYFGKKGCFFQFIKYLDVPSEPNVIQFSADNLRQGVIEEYDDFDSTVLFDNVNNFSEKSTKRAKKIMSLPLVSVGSSKSFSNYKITK
ncbi:MAG: type I-A CRISPR-associated protein Cas5 [Bacteroidetes bacterium]|nr:type I-A CRISPR-associated protein Cas5 [Bacteroidota bacterium]